MSPRGHEGTYVGGAGEVISSPRGTAEEGVARAFRGGLRRIVTVRGHGGGDFISIFLLLREAAIVLA